VKGLPSKVHSFYQQVREPTSEGFDNNSKSSEQQSASKLLALSGAVGCKSFLGEFIQPTLSNILFDLPIPSLRIKLKKPSTESGKLGRREFLNFLFDIFNLIHRDLLDSTL
jgi:hypothetical protein